EHPLDIIRRMVDKLGIHAREASPAADSLSMTLKELRKAQREILPPVTRVQMALHPWVAYGVMPLFALANAGVTLDGVDLGGPAASGVFLGIVLALVLGKPLGIIAVSWIVVRLGWSRLPAGVGWGGFLLVGMLAGIGFTMSIFIAMLAFADADLLNAAKLGVL